MQLLLFGNLAFGGGLVSRRPLPLEGRLILVLQPHDQGRRVVQLLGELKLARSKAEITF